MKLRKLLSELEHRPWKLPSGKWQYYHEWKNALFLHYEVPPEAVRAVIPQNFHLDLFEGKAYASLVIFSMRNIRPRNLPSFSFVSHFHEVNLRTYIDNDDKKGVYFISLEAEKGLSAFLSRNLSGLQYQKSTITRGGDGHKSLNARNNVSFEAEFNVLDKIDNKTSLDKWLTERYCLYAKNKNHAYRCEIHHAEWEIKNVRLKKLDVKYKVGAYDLSGKNPDLAHYSDGVEVVSWKKNAFNCCQ